MRKAITSALLAVTMVALIGSPAWSAGSSQASMSLADFLDSRTDTERKLPLKAVANARLARGEPVPSARIKKVSRATQAGATSASIASIETTFVYQINGSTAEAVSSAIRSVGADPIYVATARPYATAYLTLEQLYQVAADPAVFSAVEIAPPQPQGYFEAHEAHIGASPSDTWTSAGLAGDKVVVAILSMPIKAADLAALNKQFTLVDGGAATRVIPEADKLHQWTGVVNESFGTSDLLALMQIVYKFAPKAEFVIASPFTEYSADGAPVGVSSTPNQLADLIDEVVAGDPDNNIPAANIIIDDLFYPGQNPFEFNTVSEAIQRAREQHKALYITAAGDYGHVDLSDGSSTSSTHLSVIQSVNFKSEVKSNTLWAVHTDNGLGNYVHAFADSNGDNIGFIELAQELSDLCMFWGQKPSPNQTLDDPIVFIYSDADEELQFPWAPSGPGACLNGGVTTGGGFPAGSKVVVEWFGNSTPQLLLQGLGGAIGAAAFTREGVTQGGIRGHSSSPDAITVSSVKTCTDGADTPTIVPFSDPTCNIEVEPFSSGGSGTNYRWQYDSGESVWKEWVATSTDGPRGARQPNVAAVGSDTVVTPDESGDASEMAYSGTSVSAGVIGGIAALYWEYREKALEADGVAEASRDAVLAKEVWAALRDAAQFDGASPYAPTSPFDLVGSVLIGDGAVDAPSAVDEEFFDEPLAVATLQPVAGVGAIELDFTKSPDDFDEDFLYWVECDGLLDPGPSASPDDDGAYVWPSDHSESANSDVEYKAPIVLNAAVGSDVICSVTPRRGFPSAVLWKPSISTTATITPVDAAPATLSLASKALGIDLLITDNNEYPAGTTVTHAVECKDDSDQVVWQSNDVAEGEVVSIPTPAGSALNCSSVATVKFKTANAITATANSVQESAADAVAPVVTVTPDLGGVLISWVTDPNLASSISQSISLVCTQSGIKVLDRVMAAGETEYFLEAPDDAPVECVATATMSGTGITAVDKTSSAAQALPDPMSSGLPIWLLYQATQP